MSMITSCPTCGTMFRVVPDQLKISEGWVRCGHCAEVFDASAHLGDESILELPPAQQAQPDAEVPPSIPGVVPTPVATQPPEQAEPPQPTEAPQPAERPHDAEPPQPAEPPLRPGELRHRSEAADPSPNRSSEPSSFFGDSESLEPSPLDTPFVFRTSDLAREASSSLPPADDLSGGATPGTLEDDDDDEPEPTLDRVSFVQQARRRQYWRRPAVRVGMACLSVLLAVVLLLQLAYQDRNRLALAEPSLRPVLEGMCLLLQCTLGAPRQIEAIVVESSGFNRLRADTYRLAFTLRNTARVQVAAPAIELTITDSQDQPIARRVITPAELGSPDDTIAPGADWSRAVGLVLSTSSPGRVAGYRVLAFYP